MEQTHFSPSADGRGERSSNAAEPLLPLLIRSVVDYAIFLLDPQGRVASWNEGAERIKGYSADEILGRHFSVFYPQEAVASGFPQYELEVAAAAGRFEDEGWRLRKDGSRFWANVVITALRDETGTLVGFAKVTRDLTARRAAEEQGRRLAAEEATRAEAERRSAELLRVNDLLQDQAAELEAQNEQLQAQALELELQQEQLQELTARLQRSNEELQATLRQAEAARDDARKAEESTTAILASITDPFVVYDADWRFRYCNPRAVAVMQRAGPVGDAELSGKVVWEAFPDLAGTPLQEAMVRAMEERVPVETEAYYAKPRTWLQLHADPLPDGGLAVSWKDTTQRRRAQAAVQYLSEAGAILSSSLDYEKTLAAVAHLVVPELADWCGIELLTAGGTRLQRLVTAHVDAARVALAQEINTRYPTDLRAQRGLPEVLRTGRPILVPEITDAMLVEGARDPEHLRLMRELGLVSLMIVPLSAGSAVLGAMMLGTAESGRRYAESDLELAAELARRTAMAVENARLHRDALEARQAAERAAAEASVAAEEAAAANRAKSDFLRGMSHELRTPLNAIGGYTQILELGIHGPVTPEQREALARIQRSQRHLLSLVNDVLNFARLEAGQVEIAATAVRVRDVLSGLDTMVGPQLRDKQLAYVAAPVLDDLLAFADAERLEQILLNLLTNAVKFTPKGGRIEVGANAEGDSVEIHVRDTGIGIPQDKLRAIFEPFVQVARNPAVDHQGTGLGLAISQDLARRMGGEITVQSTLGHGSHFVVRLPRAAHGADSRPQPSAQRDDPGSPVLNPSPVASRPS